MKQGKTLMELAQEVSRQNNIKKDYLAPTTSLTMNYDPGTLNVSNVGNFQITPLCHQQIGDKLNIPRKYYERMLSQAPELLSSNVNHWLQANPSTRMVRTLDNSARAFLSGKYRRLDNFDLLEAVLPVVSKQECRVVSCEVTEKRLYLKVVSPKIEAEVKKGDPVQAGLVVSNSEIGLGTLAVSPLVYRLVCLNGQIMPDNSLRKTHLGRNQEGDGVYEMLSDATKEADDRAFWLKVIDVVSHAINQAWFQKTVQAMAETTQKGISKPLVDTVKELSNKFTLTDDESGSVLENLIRGNDHTQWGLSNAVTQMSKDVQNYDRATELEVVGGQIINLTPTEWKEIAIT